MLGASVATANRHRGRPRSNPVSIEEEKEVGKVKKKKRSRVETDKSPPHVFEEPAARPRRRETDTIALTSPREMPAGRPLKKLPALTVVTSPTHAHPSAVSSYVAISMLATRFYNS